MTTPGSRRTPTSKEDANEPLSRSRNDDLARIESVADIGEVKLSDDVVRALRAIVDASRTAIDPDGSGQANPVLFAGGTAEARTAAAEFLARDLRRALHRVALDAVVSKYIGETEKNLDAVLGDAAKSGDILFFDEADALFGRRTDVKDAHDRYANIETSYLLQRLERFEGLAILASNRRDASDSPLARRLRHVIAFSSSDPD